MRFIALAVLMAGVWASSDDQNRCEREGRRCERECFDAYPFSQSKLEGCILRCRTERAVCEAERALRGIGKGIEEFIEGFMRKGEEREI